MFRKKRKLSMLLIFLVATAIIATIPMVAAAEGTLDLYPQNVSWLVGSEPVGKKFTVQMNITNVSNFVGISFSFHWDPTYLNLTNVLFTNDCVFGTAAVPAPGGTGGTTVTPAAGNWKTITYFSDGNFSQQAYGEIPTYVPLSFTSPTWGKVVTLEFEYIGAAPSIGSPVDTDIVLVNNDYVLPGGYKMATQWVKTPGPVATTFSVLGSAHFHYEAQPMLLRRPVADFSVLTPTPIYVGTTVNFDASSSVGGCDGDTDPTPITMWNWTFGDGNATDAVVDTASNIYVAPGVYTVTLVVVAPGVGPFINASYQNTSLPFMRSVTISVLAFTGIDVYTENFRWPWYYTDANGTGPLQNASCFRPQENVDLYAYVFYNDDAVQNKLVKFYIEGPINSVQNFSFTRTAFSSNGTVWNGTQMIPMPDGVAWIPFRIPWPCDYAQQIVFGIWTVKVQVALPDVKPGEETIYEDVLHFKVSWQVTIISLSVLNGTTPTTQMKKCEDITVKATLSNCFMEPVDAVVAFAIYDDVGTIIASCHVKISMPPEDPWCTPGETTVNCTFHIPKWAYVGAHASVYANAYTWWPWEPAYAVPWCPEASIYQLEILK